MGKQGETKFKEKIWPQLKEMENSFFEKIQQVGIRGTPDFLGCVNGYFVALELKRDEDTEPEPLQEYKLKKIMAAGGVALKVDPQNWPRIFEILTQLAKGEVKIKIIRNKIKETLQ